MSGDESKTNGNMDLLAAAMRRVYREAVEGVGEPVQNREDAAVDASATDSCSERAEDRD